MDNKFFEQIIYDIRHMKQLTTEQKNTILNLNHEQKNELILIYNDMIRYCSEVLNQTFVHNNNFYK